MVYINVGFAILVGWMLMNRLASMSFSSEGKDYWMLKAAPVSAGRMMTSKFLVAYIPTLILSCVYLVGLSIIQGLPLVVLLYSLAIIILCLAGMDGLLLSFGAVGANFTWEDPRKMSSGTWGCLGMVLAPLFVMLALGLFIGPVIVTMAFNLAAYYGYLVGLVLGGGLSILCAAVPVLFSLKRVERLGEM